MLTKGQMWPTGPESDSCDLNHLMDNVDSDRHMFQNPDGVVIKQLTRSRAVDGIIAETFPLSEIVT